MSKITPPADYEKNTKLSDIIKQGEKILAYSCKDIFELEDYVRKSLKVIKGLKDE